MLTLAAVEEPTLSSDITVYWLVELRRPTVDVATEIHNTNFNKVIWKLFIRRKKS
jgi:hypothetical protein